MTGRTAPLARRQLWIAPLVMHSALLDSRVAASQSREDYVISLSYPTTCSWERTTAIRMAFHAMNIGKD
jgi:hypothetical protein